MPLQSNLSWKSLLQLHIRSALFISGSIGLVAMAVVVFVTHRQTNEYGLHEAGSYERLLEITSLEDKYSLLKFGAPFCFACAFDRPVEGDPPFDKLADQYVMYRVNVLDLKGEGQQLSDHFGIEHVPTWLVLNQHGEEIARWNGSALPLRAELEDVYAQQSEAETPMVYTRECDQGLRFGLLLKKVEDYWSAVASAEEMEPQIMKSVWIQANQQGGWDLVGGNFLTRREASAFRDETISWQEQRVDIVLLSTDAMSAP